MFHQQTESIGQKVDLVTGIHPEHILQQVCTDHLMMIMQQGLMTMLIWEITPVPSSTGMIINPEQE